MLCLQRSHWGRGAGCGLPAAAAAGTARRVWLWQSPGWPHLWLVQPSDQQATHHPQRCCSGLADSHTLQITCLSVCFHSFCLSRCLSGHVFGQIILTIFFFHLILIKTKMLLPCIFWDRQHTQNPSSASLGCRYQSDMAISQIPTLIQ